MVEPAHPAANAERTPLDPVIQRRSCRTRRRHSARRPPPRVERAPIRPRAPRPRRRPATPQTPTDAGLRAVAASAMDQESRRARPAVLQVSVPSGQPSGSAAFASRSAPSGDGVRSVRSSVSGSPGRQPCDQPAQSGHPDRDRVIHEHGADRGRRGEAVKDQRAGKARVEHPETGRHRNGRRQVADAVGDQHRQEAQPMTGRRARGPQGGNVQAEERGRPEQPPARIPDRRPGALEPRRDAANGLGSAVDRSGDSRTRRSRLPTGRKPRRGQGSRRGSGREDRPGHPRAAAHPPPRSPRTRTR